MWGKYKWEFRLAHSDTKSQENLRSEGKGRQIRNVWNESWNTSIENINMEGDVTGAKGMEKLA